MRQSKDLSDNYNSADEDSELDKDMFLEITKEPVGYTTPTKDKEHSLNESADKSTDSGVHGMSLDTKSTVSSDHGDTHKSSLNDQSVNGLFTPFLDSSTTNQSNT